MSFPFNVAVQHERGPRKPKLPKDGSGHGHLHSASMDFERSKISMDFERSKMQNFLFPAAVAAAAAAVSHHQVGNYFVRTRV